MVEITKDLLKVLLFIHLRWVYQMKIHVTDKDIQDLILDHPVPELELIIP